MLDCLIKGGTVVDGSGDDRRRADVGIRNGKVVAVGATDDQAAKTIDATDLVVCPGFIDVHTHYDAQVMWDPFATPSSLHGVTTVIGGNCGFGIAPLADHAAEYVSRMLAVVEGMPLRALETGLAWDWGTFGDWLDRLEGQLGVNAGFLAGHSVLRRTVMGGDAVGGQADARQIQQMVALLHDSLAGGAIGFSSSWAPTHVDGDARPVPSRAASAEELIALATAAGEYSGTTLAFIPGIPPFSAVQVDAMISMSRAANRPINWNTFRVTSSDPAIPEERLSSSVLASQQGGRVVALAFPSLAEFIFTFVNAAPLTGLPGWSGVMSLDTRQRMAALGDPQIRDELERAATKATGQLANLASWADLEVVQGFTAATEALTGQRVGSVAASTGRSSFDTLLDVTLADGLRTAFSSPATGDDDDSWLLRSRYWGDPRTLIGGSDAGAHLDAICGARYTTDFLGRSVRDRQLITLERAVQLITDAPARLLGLRDRGRVAEGFSADLVLLDPDRVQPGAVYVRSDLPGGASRLFSDPDGIDAVLVNGVEIVRRGQLSGDLPGTVLRSGKHLSTVTAR